MGHHRGHSAQCVCANPSTNIRAMLHMLYDGEIPVRHRALIELQLQLAIDSPLRTYYLGAHDVTVSFCGFAWASGSAFEREIELIRGLWHSGRGGGCHEPKVGWGPWGSVLLLGRLIL